MQFKNFVVSVKMLNALLQFTLFIARIEDACKRVQYTLLQ
jgi:hypothetical protein